MSIASALTWPPRSARGDLELLVGQRRYVEELRNALAPFDFDEQHLAPAGRQRQRQRGRNGRFAGAAFAGDEMQTGLGQSRWPADVAAAARCGRHPCMLTNRAIGPADKLGI